LRRDGDKQAKDEDHLVLCISKVLVLVPRHEARAREPRGVQNLKFTQGQRIENGVLATREFLLYTFRRAYVFPYLNGCRELRKRITWMPPPDEQIWALPNTIAHAGRLSRSRFLVPETARALVVT
jgi:hypothetical protein